jgi:hypothetical protein
VLSESFAEIWRLTGAPSVLVLAPGLVTVTVLGDGSVTIGWLTSQAPVPPFASLAHVG